jgi:hypothetical protein
MKDVDSFEVGGKKILRGARDARVFLSKGVQHQNNKGVVRHCELRRVNSGRKVCVGS